MPSATVRINPAGHRTLKHLSKVTRRPMPEVLDKAIEMYRRRLFLEGLADDFGALRKSKRLWKQELQERGEWNKALADGLEDR